MLERLTYHGGRPTRLGRVLNRFWLWLAASGLPSVAHQIALEVPGRTSGQPRRAVVLAAPYAGGRYLVSMLGPGSHWFRNVEANGGHAAIVRGRRRIQVRLVPVPVAGRAPILKAWARFAVSGRHHLGLSPDAPIEAFAAIAPRYPVVRIVRVRT